jgi:hypothetical protein
VVHANHAAHFSRTIEPHGRGRDTPQGCFRTPRTYEDRRAGRRGTGIGACFAWVEIFKTTNFEGISGKPVLSPSLAGSAIGDFGWVRGYRDSRCGNRHRVRPAGGNDRYVIDLNTGKLHLCNAKNAIAVWPKSPIVSVRMNLQSGTASMLTPSGRCCLKSSFQGPDQ